jgi:acylphosphatase
LIRRAHVRIDGRVQGVGFRFAMQRRAQSLGLAGWVRNVSDGGVEAVFEGAPEAVESILRWCESGPRGADVRDVAVAWEEPRGDSGGGFSVR